MRGRPPSGAGAVAPGPPTPSPAADGAAVGAAAADSGASVIWPCSDSWSAGRSPGARCRRRWSGWRARSWWRRTRRRGRAACRRPPSWPATSFIFAWPLAAASLAISVAAVACALTLSSSPIGSLPFLARLVPPIMGRHGRGRNRSIPPACGRPPRTARAGGRRRAGSGLGRRRDQGRRRRSSWRSWARCSSAPTVVDGRRRRVRGRRGRGASSIFAPSDGRHRRRGGRRGRRAGVVVADHLLGLAIACAIASMSVWNCARLLGLQRRQRVGVVGLRRCRYPATAAGTVRSRSRRPERQRHRRLEQVGQDRRQRRVDLHVLAQHRDHVSQLRLRVRRRRHVERAQVHHGVGDRDHQRLPQQDLGALLVEQRDVRRHRLVGRDLGVRVGRARSCPAASRRGRAARSAPGRTGPPSTPSG